MGHANCRGQTDVMFPSRGDHHGVATARQICNVCVVWRQCLDWAMGPLVPGEGIVAGLTPRERRQLRRDVTVEPATIVALPQRRLPTQGDVLAVS